MSEQRAAILVNLDIHKFTNEVNDSKTAHAVAKGNHARVSEDKYLRRRIPIHFLKSINQVSTLLYNTHIRYTVPWLDGGIRILPSNNILTYMKVIKELEDLMMDEVKEFANELVGVDSYNKRMRGNLYNPNDIPTAQDFIDAYSIDIIFIPLPSTADFRLDALSEDKRTEELDKYENFMTKSFGNVLPHVIQLYNEPLQRLLTNSQKDKPRYFETVFERLQDARDIGLQMLVNKKGKSDLESLNRILDKEVLCYSLYDVRKKDEVHETFVAGLFKADAHIKGVLNALTS